MSGKAVRETLAALGVIASLVFVGMEIRQNTTAVKAAAIQGMTEAATSQIHLFINDPEVNRLVMSGLQDTTQLGDEERQRFFWVGRAGWLGSQGLYRQWQLGVLPDEEWSVYERIICDDISLPGARAMWSRYHASVLVPSFVELVESCEGFAG